MLDREDLELLLAVRAHGSLSATAAAAGVVASVVTKKLAAIEARLGLPLFQRTTRRVVATAECEALCERAAPLLQSFTQLEADLQEGRTEPTGTIRLAATFGFGRLWLGPALADFQTLHPGLNVQLQLTEQLPNLAVDGYDGAVWLWSVQGRRASEWVGRRLARNQRVLVAAPSYLRRHAAPQSVADLEHHACLLVRENDQRFDTWPLRRERDKSESRVRVQGPLSSNSGELVRDWCIAGRGIMLRSLWDIAPQLASGQLVRVLPAWAMWDADIHWLAPHRAQTPKRVRLLIDFLAERFRGEPWKLKPAVRTAARANAPRGSRLAP
ncbi:LysR substrate-binding domain-containing protein [Caenimonas aquaedulcis]|uniref:LysR family transcriptional regulator n=1 Tax=Caenimonas aquaedulcis TaxID=2793270 RepID=A0A931H2J1_9BURK|nr:LysR substrate-binding domain-containing protein [Caenimonas aquaedulcis]MBG9387329.1 LysR family transcriptional regulator [Caenimonas aquaedulcis]